MTRRRERRRAADMVRPAQPRKALVALLVVGGVLTLLLLLRGSLGDGAARFINQIARDPGLELPDGSARSLDDLPDAQ